MHRQNRPMIVVIERDFQCGYRIGHSPVGLLAAMELRHMSWLEWVWYRLKNVLRRSKRRILSMAPPGFPAVNVGVWLDAYQYNILVGRDNPESAFVKCDSLPKEMVFLPPDVGEAGEEGYAV